jgi:hypothetical protein
MLERLSLNDFEPLVGSPFTMHLGEQTVELTLVTVEGHGEARDGGRAPFSLLFRGPQGLLAEQRIYRLEHETLGALEVFVVPVQPDADGSLFEIVFT